MTITTKLKKDPTKTVGVRKRWAAQFNKRYKLLKSRIHHLLLKGDTGGVTMPMVINQEFEYTNDPQQAAKFMLWLQTQINQIFFANDASASNIWQNEYIDQSYTRAIKRTKAELRKLGVTPALLAEAQAANIIGTAAPNFGMGMELIQGPIHLDAINILYMRAFNDLKGITDEMSKQINRIMVEGIEQGWGIRELARNINDRVDKIGITRSRLLARTETVRAYNIGSIKEFEAVSQRVGVEALYQWETAGDDRVRSSHEARHNKVYTKEQAFKLIGEPNCRCGLKPYIDEKLTKAA